MHAESGLLPFIEKMRDAPKWEKGVCQILVDKYWCRSNSKAASLYKEYLQLLGESGMMPDALVLRITAAFRHPVRPSMQMHCCFVLF